MYTKLRVCTNCKFYGGHYCHLRDEEVCTDNPWDSCLWHSKDRKEMNEATVGYREKCLTIKESAQQTPNEWDDEEFPF